MDEELVARCLAIAAGTAADHGAHNGRIAELALRIGLMAERPNPGEPALRSAIPEADGTLIGLRDVLGANGTVLVFTHGLWCPYSRGQLSAFADAAPKLAAAGVVLVTVTPDVRERAADLKEELGMSGPGRARLGVLIDDGDGGAFFTGTHEFGPWPRSQPPAGPHPP